VRLEKKVWGIDLDGVVAGLPYYNFCKRLKIDFFIVHCLNRLPLMSRFFYRVLRVNQKIVELLRWVAESGCKIVLITGHITKDERLLKAFLRRKRIPIHEIRTLRNIQSSMAEYLKFKLSAIIEARCDLYIDDRLSVVSFLRKELIGSGCQIIHFKNNTASFLKIEKRL